MKPTMSKYVDIAGDPIEVGDYIVYAALWSRSATLKYGRVVKLVEKKDEYSNKVSHKAQVVSVDRSWDDKWELQGGGWSKKPIEKYQVQTLGFLDRMLVVRKEQVPDEARELLDTAYKAKT